MVRPPILALAVPFMVVLGGFGSASSGRVVTAPTVAPALTYRLVGFIPSTPVVAGLPTRVAFRILLPSGQPLTRFRTGSGPHVGVDLVIVRDDDSHLDYTDTDISRSGQGSQPVVFTEGGIVSPAVTPPALAWRSRSAPRAPSLPLWQTALTY